MGGREAEKKGRGREDKDTSPPFPIVGTLVPACVCVCLPVTFSSKSIDCGLLGRRSCFVFVAPLPKLVYLGGLCI